MERENALKLLREHVKNENLIKHCLAAEAVMRALALKLGADAEMWALAGLLHDIDVDLTAGDIKRHTIEAERILSENGLPAVLIEAVKMHNEAAHGKSRTEVFHKALAAGETITGLITATALVYPDKKLSSVKVSSVVKRMKDKRFAASIDRNVILECEQIGIPLEEFAALCLDAMRGVAPELGL
ncbi:MAG: hydrolase [Elusimicrobia bacterium GWC2_51_8]|nr:MAG: hydrolase [Elusimicrobia bacterium GWA2_51_34]OGR60440.1 MAG: hydrolase [Elusimicrobia bacterium GWC2_51_8]OGR86487.1 MAG: hydrolase [Elusimicrobia bacterium GWF2_52_66]HAF94723.1 hydrolase [Elusimicrobiota bacterium]HCE97728.1 hydrolase [Elusimicrobiota bacterium]